METKIQSKIRYLKEKISKDHKVNEQDLKDLAYYTKLLEVSNKNPETEEYNLKTLKFYSPLISYMHIGEEDTFQGNDWYDLQYKNPVPILNENKDTIGYASIVEKPYWVVQGSIAYDIPERLDIEIDLDKYSLKLNATRHSNKIIVSEFILLKENVSITKSRGKIILED